MKPLAALSRGAETCSACLRRPLSGARLQIRDASFHLTPHPRLVRAFVTTPPRLQDTVTATTDSTNPYASSLTSFPELDAAITERLLTPTPKPPSEDAVLAALAALQAHAKLRVKPAPKPRTHDVPSSPASALLAAAAADGNTTPAVPSWKPKKTAVEAASSPLPEGEFDGPSNLAFRLLAHPPIFLTPAIISSYVALQRLTRDPTSLPAVLSLYATKPIQPASGRGAPRTPNPRQAKYSIPPSTALAALETAIDAGDITAALDIIDTSYATPAFRRNKIIRRALPFATVAALTPGAIWVVAQQMAQWQDTVDHSVAANYVFAGLLAYAGLTTGVGLVAAVTANDQMVRVTWVPGTPLRERWVREEERAALDAVAIAWGFEDVNKRGSEEGEEWELLREVVGRKGMILDQSTLMEGMQ